VVVASRRAGVYRGWRDGGVLCWVWRVLCAAHVCKARKRAQPYPADEKLWGRREDEGEREREGDEDEEMGE
jgi:hypothetical protein